MMESKLGIRDRHARLLFFWWIAVILLSVQIPSSYALSESFEPGQSYQKLSCLPKNSGEKALPRDEIPANSQRCEREHGRPIDPDDIYILAIGCCPPWAKIPEAACSNSVDLFLDAFLKWSGASKAHAKALLQQEATYENICSNFQWLARVADEDKLALIYLNVHGMLYSGPYKGRALEKSDVFVLWTKEYPFAALYAVWAHLWMIDEDFISRVKKIPARRKVIIVDACHPEAGELMIFSDGGEPTNYGTEEETLICSALSTQPALVRKLPKACPLFTWELVWAMKSGAPNLLAAFASARKRTLAESRILCRQGKRAGMIPPCREQTPVLIDPQNLAGSIQRKCP